MSEDSMFDEAVLGKLYSEISRLEALLAFNVITDDSLRRSIAGLIADAQKQIRGIEIQQQKEEKEKREIEEERRALSMAVLRETALNTNEKVEYESFLKEDYFTKKDSDKLEKFYTQTWDKLSEEGKAEMSHRIWEGVRHDEYQFSELPDIVKDKEAARLHGMLRDGAKAQPELQAIPIEERQAFLDAWENNDCKKAYAILDRPSFKANVAISTPPAEIKEEKAIGDNQPKVATEILAVKAPMAAPAASERLKAQQMGTLDFNLDGISIDDGAIAPPQVGAGNGRVNSK